MSISTWNEVAPFVWVKGDYAIVGLSEGEFICQYELYHKIKFVEMFDTFDEAELTAESMDK
jgi:hypothetical protein